MTMPTSEKSPARAASRRQRRFAKAWRSMASSVHQQVLPAKLEVFTDLPARIVEIGPGCGSNFVLYPRGSEVVAYEPNPRFADDLRMAADDNGLALDLRADLLSERLEPSSVDVVISTLVLCSVADPVAMVAEVERVLRPGGRLIFVEHVKAGRRTSRAAYQRVVRPAWRWFGDGCDTCARTDECLRASGLELRDATLGPLGSKLDPTNLTFWGTAVRPSDR